MTSKAHTVRVGAFMAITAGLLAVVIIVFGGIRFWEKHHHFTILFGDSVMGLEKGATVYVNGIKVGRVDSIELAPEDLAKVRVGITVSADAPIRADTKAMLQYAGITGLKVIDLRGGSLAAPLLADDGAIAQGETTLDKMEAKAIQLVDQSSQIMKRATQIVDNLVALTDPKKFQGIDEIIASTHHAADNLAKASGVVVTMVNENRAVLKDSLTAVRGAATSTQKIIDTQISGLIGSAGDLMASLKTLVHGSEGPIRSAVFDLRQASRNFKELSRDVRQRPSRLLFSSAPSERKLP